MSVASDLKNDPESIESSVVALTAVIFAPLPAKLVAVTAPLTLIPPDPVMNLLFKSRLPPNCGVVSSTMLLRVPLPPPDDAIVNPFALTLLKVILLPAVIKISSLVPSLSVSLKFTLFPDATDD